MKNPLATLLVAAWYAVAFPVAAQSGPAAFTDGEVRRVDRSAGKITLKHGEIQSLDMPPMTMVFGVKDPSMLDRVKAGDKVRFRATSEGGSFTVIELQAVK